MDLPEAVIRLERMRENLVGNGNREARRDRQALEVAISALRPRPGAPGSSVQGARD